MKFGHRQNSKSMEKFEKNRKTFLEIIGNENRDLFDSPEGLGLLETLKLTFDQNWLYLYESGNSVSTTVIRGISILKIKIGHLQALVTFPAHTLERWCYSVTRKLDHMIKLYEWSKEHPELAPEQDFPLSSEVLVAPSAGVCLQTCAQALIQRFSMTNIRGLNGIRWRRIQLI